MEDYTSRVSWLVERLLDILTHFSNIFIVAVHYMHINARRVRLLLLIVHMYNMLHMFVDYNRVFCTKSILP